MADDNDDIYNEDFSDSEGQAVDDQDEQHTQKVNGKIEALLSKIDDLQQQLTAEKKNHDKCKMDHERELHNLKQATKEEDSLASSEDKNNELNKYKALCSGLKDRLDAAMSLTSLNEGCPPPLPEEFYQYCKRHKIFPELKLKDMTIENCVLILNKKQVTAKNAKDPVIVSGSPDQGLLERIKLLEEELRLALGAAEDIRALKAKLLQMIERTRVEKEQKLRAELEAQSSRRKIEMLSDHMEKLMVHLKHEAAHKARIAEQHRLSERECNKLKEKCDLVTRKGAAKDRLVLELREGSKVLEDQLRLMDEKYLELRTKLDWARELGTKKVKKAEKTAADLRMKFALSGNSTLLDNIPLPDIYGPNGSSYGASQLNGGVSMSFDEGSWASGVMSGGNWQQQSQSHAKLIGGNSKRNLNSKSVASLSRSSSHQAVTDSGRRAEPDMESVLEKIRTQQGGRQEWTDDKIKKLTVSR